MEVKTEFRVWFAFLLDFQFDIYSQGLLVSNLFMFIDFINCWNESALYNFVQLKFVHKEKDNDDLVASTVKKDSLDKM